MRDRIVAFGQVFCAGNVGCGHHSLLPTQELQLGGGRLARSRAPRQPWIPAAAVRFVFRLSNYPRPGVAGVCVRSQRMTGAAAAAGARFTWSMTPSLLSCKTLEEGKGNGHATGYVYVCRDLPILVDAEW